MSNTGLASIKAVVHGYVQGVFFRSYIRNQANLRRLTGWVRNTKEGKVEAVFEGDKDQLQEIVEYCEKGPEGARVEDVRVEWKEHSGSFRDFEIRY